MQYVNHTSKYIPLYGNVFVLKFIKTFLKPMKILKFYIGNPKTCMDVTITTGTCQVSGINYASKAGIMQNSIKSSNKRYIMSNYIVGHPNHERKVALVKWTFQFCLTSPNRSQKIMECYWRNKAFPWGNVHTYVHIFVIQIYSSIDVPNKFSPLVAYCYKTCRCMLENMWEVRNILAI